MSDSEQTVENEAAADPVALDDGTSAPGNVRALPGWAQSMIRDLRRENASRRAEIKRVRDEAAQIDAERESDRVVMAQAAEERGRLIPRAERADQLEGYVSESVAKRVAALPDALRTLVPAYDDPLKTLAWLETNAPILSAPRVPSLDAGARGESAGARISAGEREMAAKLGVTPEQYASAKKR